MTSMPSGHLPPKRRNVQAAGQKDATVRELKPRTPIDLGLV